MMATFSKRRRGEISLLQWITLILVSLFVAVPFVVTLFGGFKSIGELRVNPFGLPQSWNTANFEGILTKSTFLLSMANSLLISVATVGLTLLFSSMAAFAMAHVRFPGSKLLMSFFMLGLLFPAGAVILPLFVRLRDFGLVDNPLGVIIGQVSFGLAFAILLFHAFFKQLPKELFDAARMDNCGYLRMFWYITLPLSLPIMATVGVFSFVASWNNYLLPLIILNSQNQFTWPLGIIVFQDQWASDWPKILAYLTLTILPAIGFFLLAQRFIVAGLTGGALKG